MEDEEIKLIEELIITIGYTLDAIRPSINTTADIQVHESKEKAVRQLEICAERLAKLKDSSLPPQ